MNSTSSSSPLNSSTSISTGASANTSATSASLLGYSSPPALSYATSAATAPAYNTNIGTATTASASISAMATASLSQSAPATTQSSSTAPVGPGGGSLLAGINALHPHQQPHPSGAMGDGNNNNSTSHSNSNNGLGLSLNLDASFFHGTPTSSNNQNLYIQVATGEHGGSGRSDAANGGASGSEGGQEFWVTCPWPSTIKKMVEHPNLVYTLLGQLKAYPTMKSKALKILTGEIGNGNMSDGPGGPGDFNLPPSPTMANAQNANLFSPNNNDSPGMWSSGNEFGTSGPSSFRAGGPGTPMTSGFPDSGQSSAGSPACISANYSSPWGGQFDSLSLASMPNNYGNLLGSAATAAQLNVPGFSPYPNVVTATTDTIDPNIMTQVETNLNLEEYIWSPADSSLYELGNTRALQAISLPGAVKMAFPPNTMIMAWEKDGSLASPAFRPLHPHSNQWLKAQVCDRRCAYRAGTSSLKRPITIRDHFRKCVYLDDHHPLKVLCTLELNAHERASQGLLPNRRRTRGARIGLKTSVEPPSPMVTRSTRPFPATRGSSAATAVKSELGSPFSAPGSGNESDGDRGGDTSATSGRGDSSHTPNESDGDFSMEKAPRSLRGITSIADSHTPVPTGLGGASTAAANAAGYATSQHYAAHQQQYGHHEEMAHDSSHPASYMMHARRHTVPDASRAVFAPGSSAANDTTFDSPFRQGGMFGQVGHDFHSQYGGLFYSAASSSSSMVGSTPSSPFLHSHPPFKHSASASASFPHGRGEPHNLRHAFTAPASPSIPVPFAYDAHDDGGLNGSAFLNSFPSIKSMLEEATVDPKGLLGSSSSSSSTPYATSPTSHSRSDDNQSLSSQSSADSSPMFRNMKSFQTASSPASPLHLKFHSEPFGHTKASTNRLFGSHMSHMMHDDSDSPFTTDFSSSEDEAFSH